MKSYHLIVDVDTKDSNAGNSTHVISRFEVWVDRDRIRTDRTLLKHTGAEENTIGRRYITCRNCERIGYGVRTTIDKKSVTPVSFEKLGLEFDARDPFKLDWSMIGFVNTGLVPLWSPQKEWGTFLKPVEKVSITDLVQGGDNRIRIETLPKQNLLRRIELLPNKSYSPALILSDAPQGDGSTKFKQTTEFDYFPEPFSGVWFPKRIRHTRLMGTQLILEEILRFDLVEINQPISPSIFTLATFDLLDNTPIQYPEIKSISDSPTWQNGKVDPSKTLEDAVKEAYEKMGATVTPPPIPDIRPSWISQNWPFLLAALLALIGLYLLRATMKRRMAR